MINEAKIELLADMKQMEFCDDSLNAVEKCKSIRDLCRVLRLFKTDLKGVSFPKIEWFRRWFNSQELKHELAVNGVFLDTEMVVASFMRNVFIYGSSKISIAVNDKRMMFINAMNDAQVNIFDSGTGLYHVELVDNANLECRKGDFTQIIISDNR